jgi:hypothetical protein
MSNATAVSLPSRESDVGRKPVENPKSIHIGIRVDEATAAALDAEIVRLKKEHPGLPLNRSDIVRMLIAEAFSSRAKRGK